MKPSQIIELCDAAEAHKDCESGIHNCPAQALEAWLLSKDHGIARARQYAKLQAALEARYEVESHVAVCDTCVFAGGRDPLPYCDDGRRLLHAAFKAESEARAATKESHD